MKMEIKDKGKEKNDLENRQKYLPLSCFHCWFIACLSRCMNFYYDRILSDRVHETKF